MSHETLCRLCISTCSTFKCLFDDTGQLNAVYEIAVKYFDSMILNPENGDKTSVICTECWQHISDFYSFQQTVIQNQSELKYMKPAVHIEKLTIPIGQTPTIKDEITTTENTISVFDIVQIQNAANSLATPDTDYDMIKDQSIILQHPSSIISSTSCEEIFRQHQQEKTEIKSITDKDFAKFNCNICKDTFSHYHLLLEHYRLNHHNEKYNIELYKMESKCFVKTSKYETNDNLLCVGPKESYSYVEISDDDRNDNTIIDIDNEFNGNEINYASSMALNLFQKRQLEYDAFIAKWRPELECPLCYSKFKKYSTFSLHFKIEHPFHKSHIICCQKRISHRYRLVQHIRLHLNPNLFKCHICGSKLKRKGCLKRHYQKQHADQLTRGEIDDMFREKFPTEQLDEIINETLEEFVNDTQVDIINYTQNSNACNVIANGINIERTNANVSQDKIINDTKADNNVVANDELTHALLTQASLPCNTIQKVVPTINRSSYWNLPKPMCQASSSKSRTAKSASSVGKYMCTQCNTNFYNNSSLRRHQRNLHKNNQSFIEEKHNSYLAVDLMSSNSNVDQLSVTSNQSYPLVIEKNDSLFDQSSIIDIKIESENNAEDIVTYIASKNDELNYEIISEDQVNVKNKID